MEKPRLLTTETVFKGYFHVLKDQLQRTDGEELSYTHFRLPNDAAVILAETLEGTFVLNKEYRHPTRDFLLGCPGGTLEPGETPLEGAIRELNEESGYTSDELHLLGCSYPLPSLCNQKIYFVLAKNAYPLKERPKKDPFEFITTELKTEKELRELIQKGVLLDSLLLTALGYWKLS
jgi:ADP-ribose pyrophosphatase